MTERLTSSSVPVRASGAQDLSAEQVQLLAWAVSNCHTLARRRIAARVDLEYWEHVQRICEKAGARSKGVLRASLPTEITEGSGNEQAWADLAADGGLPESQGPAVRASGEREALANVALSMRREAALWPKTERAQQTARMLSSFAADIEAIIARPGYASASPSDDGARQPQDGKVE